MAFLELLSVAFLATSSALLLFSFLFPFLLLFPPFHTPSALAFVRALSRGEDREILGSSFANSGARRNRKNEKVGMTSPRSIEWASHLLIFPMQAFLRLLRLLMPFQRFGAMGVEVSILGIWHNQSDRFLID